MKLSRWLRNVTILGITAVFWKSLADAETVSYDPLKLAVSAKDSIVYVTKSEGPRHLLMEFNVNDHSLREIADVSPLSDATAIARSQKGVLILDAVSGSLVSFQDETGTQHLELKDLGLVGASGLTVCASGSIVVLNAQSSLLMLETPNGDILRAHLDRIYGDKVICDGEDILLMDLASHTVSKVVLDSSRKEQTAHSVPALRQSPTGIGKITDFAAYRGIAYFSTETGIYAMARSDPTIFPVAAVPAVSVLSTKHQLLYVKSGSLEISTMPRPIPSLIIAEAGDSGISEPLFGLWRLLNSTSSFLKTEVQPPVALDTALLAQFAQTIVSQQTARSDLISDNDSVPWDPESVTILEQLICLTTGIDAANCEGDPSKVLIDRAKAGQAFYVPIIRIARQVALIQTTLTGTPMSTYINSYHDPRIQDALTEAAVSTQSSARTVERQLASMGFLPISSGQRADVLGRFVELKSGKPILSSHSLSDCTTQTITPTDQPFSAFPIHLTAHSSDLVLTKVFSRTSLDPSAFELGTDYDMTNNNVAVSLLPAPSTLGNLPRSISSCNLVSKLPYVVSAVLVSRSPAFSPKARPPKGSQLWATLRTDNDVVLDTAAADPFTVRYSQPTIIGYRLSPTTDIASARAEWSIATLPANLSPGDLLGPALRIRFGPSTIPVIQWSILVAVPENQVSRSASDLNLLLQKYDGSLSGTVRQPRISLYPMEATVIRPASGPTLVSDASFLHLKQEQKQMRSEIAFPSNDVLASAFPDLDLKSLKIGVAEKQKSINMRHPHFQRTNGGTTWDQSESTVYEGCTGSQTTPLKVADCDHGTFVAGILAGDDPELPGLLPSVSLQFVNADDPAAATKSLSKIVNQNNIQVINISVTFPEDSKAIIERLRGELQNYPSCLFVTASGALSDLQIEQGVDLSAHPEVAEPLVYFLGTPESQLNILSVAAGSDTAKVFAKYKKDDNMLAISNFGRPYVQLLALGQRVPSALGENTYGEGQGSSFAAPQVTAAAALLFSQLSDVRPGKVKARLIYTSDPVMKDDSKTADEVWGGFLNASRAVLYLKVSTLRMGGNPLLVDEVALSHDANVPGHEEDSVAIDKDNCKEDHLYRADAAPCPDAIPVSQILRLTHLAGQSIDGRRLFRVVFVRDGRLRILTGVGVSGVITMRFVKHIDEEHMTTQPMNDERSIDVRLVEDFVAEIGRVPKDVTF